MVLVSEHHELLYELDTWLLLINNTLISTMEAVSHLHFMVALMTDTCTSITRHTTGLNSLEENVDTLASHPVTPHIVPHG